MKFHPIANMFPMLSQDDLDALAADINEHGLNDSIWLFEDKVLDGRNRAKACELAGVKIKSRDFKGTYSEAVSFVWSENFHRRHLTSSQAGMAVAERKKLDPEFMRVVVEPMKEEANERMAAGKGADGSGGRGRKKNPVKKVSQGKTKTRTKLAKMHGTNATTVAACEKILEEHPEQAEAIKSGQQTVSAVIRDIKRQENIAKLESISTKKVKELEGVYDVIVIDPPWPMEKIERDCRPNQSKSLDYPTMTVEAIKAMKIPCADGLSPLVMDHKSVPAHRL